MRGFAARRGCSGRVFLGVLGLLGLGVLRLECVFVAFWGVGLLVGVVFVAGH